MAQFEIFLDNETQFLESDVKDQSKIKEQIKDQNRIIHPSYQILYILIWNPKCKSSRYTCKDI